MAITPGASAARSFSVTADDTAIALGSGDVAVLATPRMIAWCEAATVAAIADGLDQSQTTVGYKINVDHLAPTAVAATVEASATVSAVDGRRVTFSVTVTEQGETVAKGSIVRVIVDRATFEAGVS